MPQPGYKQFCPLAMAAEILCTRWTIILIREFIAGSVRFNDLRRGVPKMSPTLLSQRLKELEQAGVIERRISKSEKGIYEYHLTQAGHELGAIVDAFGSWGQKWIKSESSLENLDVNLLMWDMRRNLDSTPLPDKRTVIEFFYTDLPVSQRRWWLVVEPDGGVDLCFYDPGFDIDLYLTTDLRTMTSIWMGATTVAEVGSKVKLSGPRNITSSIQAWLGLSPFARREKPPAHAPTY